MIIRIFGYWFIDEGQYGVKSGRSIEEIMGETRFGPRKRSLETQQGCRHDTTDTMLTVHYHKIVVSWIYSNIQGGK